MFGNLLAVGAVETWVWIAGLFFIALCVFLIGIVLLQKGRGDGLSSALGGAGGQSAFGSKTGDRFTVITIGVVVLFFLSAIFLSVKFAPENRTAPTGQEMIDPASKDAGDTETAPEATTEKETETE